MTRTAYLIGSVVLITANLTVGRASTQEGDRVQGLALARQICSECHAIDRSPALSPNPAAPRFEVIANVPGMSPIALTATLQTSHRTMPNLMLSRD